MLRGSERIRLIAMLGTLCILGAIVFRSMKSDLQKPPAAEREIEENQAGATKRPSKSGDRARGVSKPAEKESVAPGPSDEDPEEVAAAEEEFQALTDGTLGILPEEMFAYRRVFGWVEHQSFAEMKERADPGVSFDDLMRRPEMLRGKLMQVDLNVRQVIPGDGKALGVKTVYELWGFSQDSGSWLYSVIVPALPEGMPTGRNLEERMRVEGYFFKLQGYLEAGAKPRAAPLKAPLLIGRAARLTSAGEKKSPTDYNWLYYAAAGFVFVSFIFTLAQFFARRKAQRHRAQLDEYKIERGRASLNRDDAHVVGGPLPPEDKPDDEGGFDFR
ncbi:MAG: hypothetical protein IT426_16910 [Pirellulales bacterium]|nr:hypothetical protein [Pirellulales bacterium]